MYTCIHTHKRKYSRTHTTQTHTHTNPAMQHQRYIAKHQIHVTHMNTIMRVYTHPYTTRRCFCICAHIHLYVHVHTCTYVYIHAHTGAHIYVNMRTYATMQHQHHIANHSCQWQPVKRAVHSFVGAFALIVETMKELRQMAPDYMYIHTHIYVCIYIYIYMYIYTYI